LQYNVHDAKNKLVFWIIDEEKEPGFSESLKEVSQLIAPIQKELDEIESIQKSELVIKQKIEGGRRTRGKKRTKSRSKSRRKSKRRKRRKSRRRKRTRKRRRRR
jgi:hypothetical protein